MTIRKRMELKLEEHGLWPEEAKTVVSKAEESMKEMNHRWDEDTENYPPQLLAVLWASIKHTAKEYLKETKPQHFAIAMLE